MNVPARHWVVVRLGTAQTLAWASSYYLPALLAQPMARDLGVGTSTIFAAFSLALVVSAQGSASDRSPALFSATVSAISNRSRVDLANRSRRVTITTSSDRRWSSISPSWGRSR